MGNSSFIHRSGWKQFFASDKGFEGDREDSISSFFYVVRRVQLRRLIVVFYDIMHVRPVKTEHNFVDVLTQTGMHFKAVPP